jgi:hypothetical protein
MNFCVYLVSCDGLCVVGLPHDEGGRGVEHLRHEDDGRAWGSHHISHQNGGRTTLDLQIVQINYRTSDPKLWALESPVGALVHKTTSGSMTYDLYGPVSNVYYACRSITWASGRGMSVSVKNLIPLFSTRVSTFKFENLKGPLTFIPGEVFEMVFYIFAFYDLGVLMILLQVY